MEETSPAADRSPELSSHAWTTVPECALLVVPLGSCEQHGPHLPLLTDTDVAISVARDLTERAMRDRRSAVVAPPIAYGASGEHEGFPGTISLGTEVLHEVLVEFGRSASRWAGRIVFVTGHGGNVEALGTAIAQLRAEGRDAAWLPCETGAVRPDLHAGEIETALMLALAPERVRMERAVAGDTRSLHEVLPELRERGVRAVSPNGVLGDPSGASEEVGRGLWSSMFELAWKRVRAWSPAENGLLLGAELR